MDKKRVIVNVSWDENYCACSDILPGCVAAHETLEGVKRYMRTAVEWHLEAMRTKGEDIPEEFQEEYQLYFRLNVPALMQKYKGVITHSGLERLTGINKRQLQHYAMGLHKPLPLQRKKIERALHTFGRELQEVEL